MPFVNLADRANVLAAVVGAAESANVPGQGTGHHPDAYLSDLLLGNHEVIGSLIKEREPEAADIPVYFFPAMVSTLRPSVKTRCLMCG